MIVPGFPPSCGHRLCSLWDFSDAAILLTCGRQLLSYNLQNGITAILLTRRCVVALMARALTRGGLVGAERPLIESQGLLIQGFDVGIAPLGVVEHGQMVKAHDGVWMGGAQHLLVER